MLMHNFNNNFYVKCVIKNPIIHFLRIITVRYIKASNFKMGYFRKEKQEIYFKIIKKIFKMETELIIVFFKMEAFCYIRLIE